MDNLTINTLNHLGSNRIPFLFVIDFAGKSPWVCPLSEVDSSDVLFEVNGVSNFVQATPFEKQLDFKFEAVDNTRYQKAFNRVQEHIGHGDSFLLNLTFPGKIKTNFTLQDIFCYSKARYKLRFKDRFVVFSPEIFIKTEGRKISSFPMKGTMDATLPDAESRLLNSEKELAEHYTIVDLIRNDLSRVAKNVKVEKFRNIEKIKTHRGELLQMSSMITGTLPENYREKLGDILFKLLPAGSVSGAPKRKTLEIIKEAEQYDRGYYTGIFGLFDGKNMDSGVMIRFIEKTPDGLVYKSGGGITAKSKMEEEYRELIDKIYIPV